MKAGTTAWWSGADVEPPAKKGAALPRHQLAGLHAATLEQTAAEVRVRVHDRELLSLLRGRCFESHLGQTRRNRTKTDWPRARRARVEDLPIVVHRVPESA